MDGHITKRSDASIFVFARLPPEQVGRGGPGSTHKHHTTTLYIYIIVPTAAFLSIHGLQLALSAPLAPLCPSRRVLKSA